MNAWARRAVAITIGVACGVVCSLYQMWFGWSAGGDIGSELRSALPLLAGQNPYVTLKDTWPLYYPLPTLLFLFPLWWLPLDIAAGAFFGATSGALALRLSGDGAWRLLFFLGFPFWGALQVAQWSPLICLAFLCPAFLPLSLLKPSTGLPIVLASRWDKRQLALVAAAVGASLIILPTWPRDWLRLLGGHPDVIPATLPPGLLCLLLVALNWRLFWGERAGRMFALLLCIPQTLFYDTLLLWLLPSSRRQLLALAVGSWIGYAGWAAGLGGSGWLAGWMYLPALGVYLRQHRPARLGAAGARVPQPQAAAWPEAVVFAAWRRWTGRFWSDSYDR